VRGALSGYDAVAKGFGNALDSVDGIELECGIAEMKLDGSLRGP
jgi:hypothetical protein